MISEHTSSRDWDLSLSRLEISIPMYSDLNLSRSSGDSRLPTLSMATRLCEGLCTSENFSSGFAAMPSRVVLSFWIPIEKTTLCITTCELKPLNNAWNTARGTSQKSPMRPSKSESKTSFVDPGSASGYISLRYLKRPGL